MSEFVGSRRPSTPGQNTQILFNKSGVDGASPNLTFDFANNSLNVAGSLNVTANIANTGNLAVSQNTVTGNLSVVQNITTGNLVSANINGLNSNASLVGVMYISYMGVY